MRPFQKVRTLAMLPNPSAALLGSSHKQQLHADTAGAYTLPPGFEQLAARLCPGRALAQVAHELEDVLALEAMR
jgi:hypothetical protein